MNRRDFLKSFSGLLLGVFVVPFTRLFGSSEYHKKDRASLKEAKYYKSGKDLAG